MVTMVNIIVGSFTIPFSSLKLVITYSVEVSCVKPFVFSRNVQGTSM